MSWRKCFIFAVTVSSILIFGGVNFAQQEGLGETATVPDVQWLWGEAASVDTAKGEVVVKYLDYETEQEKQVTISTDDKTTFENVNSLAQVKTADTLSIDYIVDKNGKNLAKNISVEKPEEVNAPEVSAPVQPPMESLPGESTEVMQPSGNSTPESVQKPVGE
jgi:hypothetical protein